MGIFRAIYQRYHKASLSMKTQILEEFCHVCGYNRKYAITKLNGPTPQFKSPAKHQRRSLTYSSKRFRSCKPFGRLRATPGRCV